jgi:Haem-binding domain
MFKRWRKRLGLGAFVVFVVIQLVPIKRDDPPVNPALALNAPPAVTAILRQSCYDCHSDQTVWPWYAHVAPVSWFVTHHVNHARAKMDFSHWYAYSVSRQQDYLDQIKDAVTYGWMPLSSYLWIHRDAVLSPAQADTVADWAGNLADSLDSSPPAPSAPKPSP